MNRKLLTLLLIMVVAAATITVVSAAETVTVNGVEFNVPDGFKSQPESDQMSYVAYNGEGKIAFLDSDNGTAVILGVLDNNGGVSLDDIKNSNSSYIDKTIAGKDGIIADNGKTLSFIYIENDKLMTIYAPTESLLEETIK